MKQDPNAYYLYLDWPEYLAQWYAHCMHIRCCPDDPNIDRYQYDTAARPYDLEPVETPRTGVERTIILQNLCPQTNPPEMAPEHTTIALRLPDYHEINTDYKNRLSNAGKRMLVKYVTSLFDAELYIYVSELKPMCYKRGCVIQLQDLYYGFMEKHGIDCKYFDAIKKRYWRTDRKVKAEEMYQSKLKKK